MVMSKNVFVTTAHDIMKFTDDRAFDIGVALLEYLFNDTSGFLDRCFYDCNNFQDALTYDDMAEMGLKDIPDICEDWETAYDILVANK